MGRFALLLLFAVRALAGIGPPNPDIVGTAGNRVLFNAALDLWSSDGTAEGTMRIFSAIDPGSARVQFHGLLYFTKPVGKSYGNPQLWRTDGTAAGTQLVIEASVGIQAVTAIGDSLWIQTPQRAYLSDGTAAGTVVVPQPPRFDSWPEVCVGHAVLVGRSERPALREPLHVLLEIAPRHEDATRARHAAEADVGPEPDDAPRIAAAGMQLAEDDDVVEIEGDRTLRPSLGHGREV